MIYFLDGNQRVIKIVRSEAVISAIQTQELPEDSSLLKDVLSVRLKNDERLFNAQYMAIKSYGGNRNAFDLYRIVNEIVPDNATSFEGVQIAPYELQGVVIEDLRPHNRPLDLTINQLLKDTDWTLGYVASNMPTVTTNFYYVSVKDALKKLQEMYGVEMIFKVEISGNRITSKWVEVYHQLGNRTMKRFNYGTNALSVVRESSQNELYTALIGRGKGEEVSSAEENESGQAGYGRKITFEDVEWSVANGDPVNKPKGQKYIELPDATAEYGIRYKNGGKMPRVGLVEFSDTEDPEVLIEQTYQELLVRARPKVLFKASVINIGDVLIGDTVTIHRHDLGFHYQARVRKVVRDRKNNNKTQVEIGDVVHTPSTQRQKDTDSKLDNISESFEDVLGEVNHAQQSANGKNTNYYGNAEPQNPRVGDLWFRDHPSIAGERQMLMWDGEAWELILDTSWESFVENEIEEARGIAEDARDNTEALKIEADSILAGLGVEGIRDTHQDIVDQIQAGVGDRIDGLVASKVDGDSVEYQTLIQRHNLYSRVIGSTETGINDSVSRIVQSSGIVQTEVSGIIGGLEGDVDDLSTQVTQLAGSWALRITSNDELVAAINASSNGVYIQGKNIVLDGDTIVDGTFTVTNDMIAPGITADKITSGTIDANNVRVINLDVDSISGFTSSFFRTNWDAAYSSVSITGDSVGMIHSNTIRDNGYAFELTDEEVRIGVPMYAYEGLDMRANDIVFGRDMTISANTNPGQWLHFRQSGSDIMRMGSEVDVYRQLRLNGNSISLGGGQYINSPGNVLRFLANSTLQMSISANSINTYTTMRAGGNIAMNGSHIYFDESANIYAPSVDELQINVRGNRRALFRNADISFWNKLNMRGYNISEVGAIGYASDAKLKENITDRTEDDLATIMAIDYKNYDMINGNKKQRGFIAQQLLTLDSDLIAKASDGTLNYDGQGYVHTIGHAVQQLALDYDMTKSIVTGHTNTIAELQNKINQLKQKVEELEKDVA